MTTTTFQVIRCRVATTSRFVECRAALEPADIERHMRQHFKPLNLPRFTPQEWLRGSYVRVVTEESEG